MRTIRISERWKGATLAALCAVILFLSACAAGGPGMCSQGSIAAAGLNKNNFRVVQSNVRGDSYGFRFLMFLPIVSARVADAKEDLYHKLRTDGINFEGRSIAFANVTEDQTAYYFLIGSVPRITLTADVIEFLDEKPMQEQERAKR
ncbi:MAG TPA: hypothetical protein VN666_07835 [Nitrospira sp.]|nr:hypothetical protein [Nitrospira sp.]